MNKIDRRTVLRIASASALLAATPTWAKSAYPSKPIRLVVPFGPGSFTDVVTREIAKYLSAALGQPIVVENKPGASTNLAPEVVSRAAPDGYTLLVGTVGGMASNPAGLTPTVPYNVAKDFTPISHIGAVTYALLVNPSIPANNMEELINYARENPGLKFGYGNFGGLVYMSMLANTQRLDMLSVPYKSSPPALVALAGGFVDILVTDVNSALPLQKAGKVKILAIPGTKRSALAPDIPTLEEAGVKGIQDVPGWIGLYGPANLPLPIVSILSTELNKCLRLPEMLSQAEKYGLNMHGSTPAELATYTRDQTTLWKELIVKYKLVPQN